MSDHDSEAWESDNEPQLPMPVTGTFEANVAGSKQGPASDAAAAAIAALGPLAPVTVTLETADGQGSTKTSARKVVNRLSPLQRAARETNHRAELVGLLAAQVHQLRHMHSPHLQAQILSRVPADVIEQLHFNTACGCPHQDNLSRFVAWFRFSCAVQNYCVPAPDALLSLAHLMSIASGDTVERFMNPHALVAGTQLELVLVFGALLLSLGARVRLVSVHDANAVSGPGRFKSRIGWAHSTLNSRFGLSAAKSSARAARVTAAAPTSSQPAQASRPPPNTSPAVVDVRAQEQATQAAHQRAGCVSTAALRMRNGAHGALVWLEVLTVPAQESETQAGSAAKKRGKKHSSGHAPAARWMHVDMLREWVDAPQQVCTLRAKQYPLAYVVAVSAGSATQGTQNRQPLHSRNSAAEARFPPGQFQYSTVAGPRLLGLQACDVTQRYAESTAAALKLRKTNGSTQWWEGTLSQLNATWLPSLLRCMGQQETTAAAAQYLLALLHGLVLMQGGSGSWGEHRTEYSFELILKAGLQAAGSHLGISLAGAGAVANQGDRDRTGAVSPSSDVELLSSDTECSPTAQRTHLGNAIQWDGHWRTSAAAAARADAAETAELALAKCTEPLPTSKAAFRAHPRFAIESQCGNTEMVHPCGPEHQVGLFKGEPVYPRSHVQKLLTKERWLMEHSRVVLDSEVDQPTKVTTKKIRPPPRRGGRGGSLLANPGLTRSAMRASMDMGQGGSGSANSAAAGQKDVNLYGRWQTGTYQPGAVSEDGKIPVNSFGNVEVWGGRSDMVPTGAVHLTGMPGAGRVASQLGFDWARAVVGFEFKGGMMVPKTDGIVIPAVAEEVVVAAWEQAEIVKADEAVKKRSARAVRNWTVLGKGVLTLLYIRERRSAANVVGSATHLNATQSAKATSTADEAPGVEATGGNESATDAGTISTLPNRKLLKRARSHGDSAVAAASPEGARGSKAQRGHILDSSTSGSDAEDNPADSDGFADSAVFGTSGNSSDSSSMQSPTTRAHNTRRVEDYDEL